MMAGITIHIPGRPVPKGRPRFVRMGKFTRAVTPKETDAYETTCRWYMKKEMGDREPLNCALSVAIECVMPIPESWSQRKKDHAGLGSLLPTGKPDSDNLCKSLLDAGNGILFRDDSLIVDLRVTKRYGEPGATMTIMPIDVPAAATQVAA